MPTTQSQSTNTSMSAKLAARCGRSQCEKLLEIPFGKRVMENILACPQVRFAEECGRSIPIELAMREQGRSWKGEVRSVNGTGFTLTIHPSTFSLHTSGSSLPTILVRGTSNNRGGVDSSDSLCTPEFSIRCRNE